jgi:hypothetical protein
MMTNKIWCHLLLHDSSRSLQPVSAAVTQTGVRSRLLKERGEWKIYQEQHISKAKYCQYHLRKENGTVIKKLTNEQNHLRKRKLASDIILTKVAIASRARK